MSLFLSHSVSIKEVLICSLVPHCLRGQSVWNDEDTISVHCWGVDSAFANMVENRHSNIESNTWSEPRLDYGMYPGRISNVTQLCFCFTFLTRICLVKLWYDRGAMKHRGKEPFDKAFIRHTNTHTRTHARTHARTDRDEEANAPSSVLLKQITSFPNPTLCLTQLFTPVCMLLYLVWYYY